MLTDLRFALRLLVKSPGLTVAAVCALGFGIGLSTAVFNVFSAMLLRPFPYIADERSLVFLNSQRLGHPDSFYELSLPDFYDLRQDSKTLEGFTTTVDRTMIFTDGKNPPIRALGADISVEGFAMLGTSPLRGRVFDAADAKPGAPQVALIGYGLWHRLYGGRDDTIGRTVPINGRPHTIIGVMPKGFAFPDNHEMWTPLTTIPTKEGERGSHSFPGWARLRPGVSLDEACTEAATLAARLARQYPSTNDGKTLVVRPAREEATHDSALLMQLMLGAALTVLLIACANVANLLLARAAARTHEIAIRVAVGASRWQIIRQIMTESLVLGLLGGAFGLLVAAWSENLLFSAVPHEEIPFWMNFGFDWRVFTFTAAAAILSPLVFGFFPALQASRSAATALREGSRTATAGRRTLFLRHALVVTQVALSAVLLITAGLFIRSFLKLATTPPGYDRAGVITFRVGLPPSQYTDKDHIRRFFEQLDPALAALPGVQAAGSTSMLPGKSDNRNVFLIEGRPEPVSMQTADMATTHTVSPGYLAAMRIPLLRGRTFSPDDTRDKPLVVLVDQQFADRLFPGADPIGQRVSLGLSDGYDKEPRKWAQIIGIVGNVPQHLDRPYDLGSLYFAASQSDANFVNYALRVTGDPATYGKAITQAVLSVQSDIPIYNLHTMEYLHAAAYWKQRFFSQVFSAFGLGALFLAALGVYGVMSYAVVQRTAEIGVRMALGASESQILRLVARQGAWLIALGLTLGLLTALGVTRLLAGLLYRVSPSDPPTYFAFTFLLAVTGLLACVLPVRRATRIAPMAALRTE